MSDIGKTPARTYPGTQSYEMHREKGTWEAEQKRLRGTEYLGPHRPGEPARTLRYSLADIQAGRPVYG